jgi:hypothetical protein
MPHPAPSTPGYEGEEEQSKMGSVLSVFKVRTGPISLDYDDRSNSTLDSYHPSGDLPRALPPCFLYSCATLETISGPV